MLKKKTELSINSNSWESRASRQLAACRNKSYRFSCCCPLDRFCCGPCSVFLNVFCLCQILSNTNSTHSLDWFIHIFPFDIYKTSLFLFSFRVGRPLWIAHIYRFDLHNFHRILMRSICIVEYVGCVGVGFNSLCFIGYRRRPSGGFSCVSVTRQNPHRHKK